MENKVRIIEYCVCKRCNYEWWPTKPKNEVSNCPRCRSTTWNRDKKDNKGYRNGRSETIWKERIKQEEGD